MQEITSKNNEKIKDLIKIRDDKKFRKDKSLFYVEGERIISNISPKLIKSLFIIEDRIKDFTNIIKLVDSNDIYILKSDVFNKVKDTITSQGIIALIKIEKESTIDYTKINKILILDNIKDPGNLGTIIRTSEASGFDLIILTSNCCDIYNTKTIRASMSSITRMNIIVSNNIINTINNLKENDYKIYTSYLNNNSINLYKTKFEDKIVIVIGSESEGVSEDILKISDISIMIPMYGDIESLNVSSATSIILYEVYRQKYES